MHIVHFFGTCPANEVIKQCKISIASDLFKLKKIKASFVSGALFEYRLRALPLVNNYRLSKLNSVASVIDEDRLFLHLFNFLVCIEFQLFQRGDRSFFIQL